MFWQPKEGTHDGAAGSSAGPGAAAVGQAAVRQSRGFVKAPGAVAPVYWELLQNRTVGGDWAAAIGAAHSLEKGLLFEIWLETDPEAAMRWYLAPRGGGIWIGPQANQSIAAVFASKPELGWKVAEETGNVESLQWLLEPIDALAGKHPDIIRAMLKSRRFPDLAKRITEAMAFPHENGVKALVASDPGALAQLWLLTGNESLLQQWSKLDPGAEERLRALANPAQNLALDQWKWQQAYLSERDLAKATQMVLALPDSALRRRFMSSLVLRTMRERPEAAYDLVAKNMADGVATLEEMRVLAEHDENRAREMARRAGFSEDEVFSVHRRPLQADPPPPVVPPEQVAASLTGAAAETKPPAFFGRLAARWVAADPEAASTWAGALPAGSRRDGAIVGMVGALSGAATPDARPALPDFDRALQWATAIGDGALRLETSLGVIRRLFDVDPARAEAMVRSAGWSEESRAAVMAELGLNP